ncbi:DUF6624 domain-containing protein [Rufibacter quisquiliarum]|uniref:Uncharacterized protein n=1 Tax=Rufibacter quisquiliarum TaxID=1549639 RepID=A0A839GG89_9BACT|nr:DUF6624 domain-containing protein [Rufibacter quisquiliarum]MBA9075669.1 hypothetical protein [Rufibacter quisquiliarum]
MKKNLTSALLLLLCLCGIHLSGQAQAIPYDSLRVVLEKIHDTDQGIRLKGDTVKEENMNAFFAEMQAVDSVNQLQVQAILGRYGWLPKSKVGEKAANGLFYVVQHSPTRVIAQYLPELQKMAAKGEADKTLTAMMEDRLLMFQNKKQIYGSQATSMLRKDGSYAIWPIEDPKNVNKRRKAAGFTSTVEENAKRLKAAYDPAEKIPPNQRLPFH